MPEEWFAWIRKYCQSAVGGLALYLLTFCWSCEASCQVLDPAVRVPKQYVSSREADRLPNGSLMVDGYTTTYREFWLNCVMVKSRDVSRQCPWLCSGTPAVAAACADGAANATSQIAGMLRRFPRKRVLACLRAYSTQPGVVAAFRNTRFHGDPDLGE